MLTAIRELAEEAERGSGLDALLVRGDACVAATRETLAVLREAGVVDAGAAGLVEIGRGIAGVLSGTAGRLPVPTARSGRRRPATVRSSSRTPATATARFLSSRGRASTRTRSSAPSSHLGDSLLVVGDPSALKIHVHTDDPGRALSIGVAAGVIAGVEIADMRAQTRAREQRLLHAASPASRRDERALVAVAAGAGNRRLLESLGALVVDGGRTMNPSTAEILAALEGVSAPPR